MKRAVFPIAVIFASAIWAACAPTSTLVPVPPTAVPRPTETLKPTAAPTTTRIPPTATRVLPPSATPIRETRITILHTNDTHGHLDTFRIPDFPDPVGGVARRATLIAQIRREVPNVLLVDAGDVHQGILMADTFKGEPDIRFMNLMDYNAMGLGNRDLDWGWATLKQRRSAAQFPIICANLVYPETNKPVLTPYIIRDVVGIKIALTSLAGSDFRTLVKPENIPGMRFADPIETAKTLVPELRQQANLVVLLGHQLLKDDIALATAVPGIDIIIGGHEHARLNEILKVGNTIIVEDWQFGAFLGRLDLTIRAGKIASTKYQLIPVANSVSAHAYMETEIRALTLKLREMKPERFVVLGDALVDITDTDIRNRETAIGNWTTDVMRQEAKADIAFSTSSSFLSSLFKGPITVNNLMEALPYQNTLVTVRLTGAQIKQVIEWSTKSIGTGAFSQVSGVSFTIAKGRVEDIKVGGAPLDENKLYLVATTNYQADIAAGYKDIFKAGQDYADTGKDINELIMNNIRAQRQVSAKVEGRITLK